MDHGGLDEGQGVLAQLQDVALLDHDPAVLELGAEEVLHHGEGLGGADDGRLGIGLHEQGDVGAVVGLHVLDHQVVGLPSAQLGGQVGEPLAAEFLVHGVHDGDLAVHDGVGVVGHAQRHLVLPLEQVYLMVVDADVADVLGYVHNRSPLSIIFLESEVIVHQNDVDAVGVAGVAGDEELAAQSLPLEGKVASGVSRKPDDG